MGLTPRPPCFQQIWRDVTADEAWWGFTDGTIYHYTNPGSAAQACEVAYSDPHGTIFNHTARIPHGGTGYAKVSSVPGTAQLIYSNPPYDNSPPLCGPCDGVNTDWANVNWNIDDGGPPPGPLVGTGMTFTVSEPFTPFPLFSVYATPRCFNQDTTLTVVVENLNALEPIDVIVDFNLSAQIILTAVPASGSAMASGPVLAGDQIVGVTTQCLSGAALHYTVTFSE